MTAQQGTGAVTLQPIIQGTPAGTTFAVNPANQYTLRIRVHCPGVRESAIDLSLFGDSGLITAGGEWILGPGKIQMEIQEFVNGVGATPVTLYDGAIANLPGSCMVVPASSINLIGTMRAVNLTNLGSGWVVSTPPSGGPYTRRLGTTAEAAECQSGAHRQGGVLHRIRPVAGEQIAVSYRTVGRAVGRAVNAASQQALAQAGSPSVAAWIGSVTSPPARSSADCRNAALVMEQAAAGVSALWSGTYKGSRASFRRRRVAGRCAAAECAFDESECAGGGATVKVSYRASYPDLVEYAIAFANDWADDLAIKTSATVPENAWLPAPVAPTVLANLARLTVTALNGSTVTVNTGVTPPRAADLKFGCGTLPSCRERIRTLVMRGSQQNLTFSRVSANDRFYIRMYDGSTPPNYSEFSTALFINLPLSS